jgi:hypothetical protein
MSTEPRDVGPLYGGDRPILESDRRLVEDLLDAARAYRKLSPEEHTRRMVLVYQARVFDDLVPIARDLL